jgi:hypothetical protein
MGLAEVSPLVDVAPMVKSQTITESHVKLHLINWSAESKHFGVPLGSLNNRPLFMRIDHQGQSSEPKVTRVLTYTFTLEGG